jgi:3-hydroxybutyryl-CoA dehydratase
VHFDDRFAKVKEFHGRICHGLLVVSILTEIGGQIGWLASGMSFRFKNPVYFGDTIECRFTITELDDLPTTDSQQEHGRSTDLV